jgi:hypothetical protein
LHGLFQGEVANWSHDVTGRNFDKNHKRGLRDRGIFETLDGTNQAGAFDENTRRQEEGQAEEEKSTVADSA